MMPPVHRNQSSVSRLLGGLYEQTHLPASSTITNFVHQSTWIHTMEVSHDTEVKARIHGVSAQMKTFQYLYGIMLAELILQHADNLSRMLQYKCLSAAEGHSMCVARMAVKTEEY